VRLAPRLLGTASLVAAAALLLTGCTGDASTTDTSDSATPSPSSSGPAPSTTDPWATWDAALASVDAEPARWLALGDSITEGQGASALDTRWVDLARDGLRAAHPVEGVPGGVGYRPAAFATYGPDSPWAQWAGDRRGRTSVDTSTPDLGFRALELSPGASLRYDVVGTDLDLWWTPGGGTFRYRVDAGAEQAVDTSVAASTTGITSVTGLASGPHAVTISVDDDAGSGVVLQGLAQFDGDRDRGVALVDSARSGATVSTFTDDLPAFLAAAAAAEPDLVTITLGANDAVTTGPDELAERYTTLIEGLQSLDSDPTVLVVDEFTEGLSVTSAWDAPAADYRAALDEVVEQTGVASVTVDEALASAGGTDLGALLSADGLHPNDDGQRVLAAFMTETLARQEG